jgi:hypothetical protein
VAGNLRNLIAAKARNPSQLVEALNQTGQGLVTRYNSESGPRLFGRRPAEQIPSEPRRLTEFRARLGALIEYALGFDLRAMIFEDSAKALFLTFVVNNQFPDFYIRDANWQVLLRVDSKILHDQSAEKSARFELPLSEIRQADDFIMYTAWRWARTTRTGTDVVYPHVSEILFVPAFDLAQERDRSLELRGGRVLADGTPLVSSGERDTNFGKVDRMVHVARRDAADLSPHVRTFLEFVGRYAEAVEAAGMGARALTSDELQPVESDTSSESTSS